MEWDHQSCAFCPGRRDSGCSSESSYEAVRIGGNQGGVIPEITSGGEDVGLEDISPAQVPDAMSY